MGVELFRCVVLFSGCCVSVIIVCVLTTVSRDSSPFDSIVRLRWRPKPFSAIFCASLKKSGRFCRFGSNTGIYVLQMH